MEEPGFRVRADSEAPASARFGTVAVIGVGLMGGSLGMALSRRGLASRVLGCDRDPSSLQAAVRLGAVDEGSPLEAAVSEADLVVMAVPVPALPRLFGLIGPHLKQGAVVTDLGSVKRPVLEAAQALPHPEQFVGGHPLAGRERAGVAAADGDLFLGRAWAVVPGPSSRPEAVEMVAHLARAVGADPVLLGPDEHDCLAAEISHLPQLAAYALAAAVARGAAASPGADGSPGTAAAGRGMNMARRLAGPGLRDTTRLAASPAGLWRDLALANRDHLVEGLKRLQSELDEVSRALEAGDGEALEGLFRCAQEARLALFP